VSITIPEIHAMDFAVAADAHFDLAGQGIDHGHADSVQAARELVVAIGEFAARMQAGQDQFDAGDAFLGVDVHRHAAAIVGHRDRAIRVHDDFDGMGMSGKGFVNRVVDDFLDQMVGARGVGVHARSTFDRFEAREHLDVCCGVATAHCGYERWGDRAWWRHCPKLASAITGK